MIYLALDPGLTTGVAWYNTASEEFGSLEVRGEHALYEYLVDDWGFLYKSSKAPDVLAYELWTPRAGSHRMSNQPEPRNIGGACEVWAWWLDGLMWLERQTPGQAKGFSSNDKLRTLGWYSGGEGHADDAARHLLLALARDGVGSILEKLL